MKLKGHCLINISHNIFAGSGTLVTRKHMLEMTIQNIQAGIRGDPISIH